MSLESPIFISGLRKSGTSMVKNLFDGHPDLFVFPPNEVHFFRHTPDSSFVKDKAKKTTWSAEKLKEYLRESRFIQRMGDESSADHRAGFDLSRFNDHVKKTTVKDFPEVYRAIFNGMLYAVGKDPDRTDQRLVSKTVLETEYFPVLKEWFPDLKFIYVLRNPYAHFNAARNSLRANNGAKEWRKKGASGLSVKHNPYPLIGEEIQRMWHSYRFMEKFRSYFTDSFLVLNYDKLLQDPQQEIAKLCHFLGIQEEECLYTPTILGELWGGNSWYNDQGFDSIDRSPLYHWQNEITDGEVKVLNHFFYDVIQENFELLPSRSKIWKKLHPSEKLGTYWKNRLFFYRNLLSDS